MRKRKRKSHLVWMDLEMTGLDPERHHILEIATIITDGKLNFVAQGPHLVIHQPPRILNAMDGWSKKQHRKSGLTKAVERSGVKLADAERQTLRFLRQYCVPRKAPLCGNVVHHDRLFMKKYLPRLDRFLDYHHVDVSTVEDLVEQWYPKGKKFPEKKESHRALDDIRESIKELRFYRTVYFKAKAGKK